MHVRKVTVKTICLAIKNEKIFRGNRDDWGSGAEAAYEVLENLLKTNPNDLVTFKTTATVGKVVKIIRMKYTQCVAGNEEGIKYLADFKNVVLSL